MKVESVFKYTHLTLSDRIAIEQGLKDKLSFKAIAEEISKDPTTVSKEIRRYIGHSDYVNIKVDCMHFERCRVTDLCHTLCFGHCRMCTEMDCRTLCDKWEPAIYEKLLKPPYVCNACESRNKCKKPQLLYRASRAHKQYETKLVESRK